MEPLVASQNLSVVLATPLAIDFVIDQIDVTEAISELYEVVIHVHTTEPELAFDDLLGEVVSATVSYTNADTTPGDVARIFAGIVGRIHQRQTFVAADGATIAYYTFYLYPELWRANLNQDCRIFQDQSVEDITETLFGEYNISDTTIDIQDLPDPTRVYCLQYNESIFKFLSRLWEEEGIAYFFTHSATGSMLTLTNDTQSHIDPIDPATIVLQNFERTTFTLNTIQNITYEKSIIPNQVDTTDYDDANPSNSLNIVSPASDTKGGRVFEYPGKFATLDQGEKLAQFRSEEITWDSVMMKGESTVLAFSPHMSFTLDQHPRDEWNRGYILYKIVHRLRFNDSEGQNELVYDNIFWAFPDDVPFRPKRNTPKPRIDSQHTAKVVGPAGEEIYTDELGRIKIQFPWDNYGNNDDASSLWVRVARTWAGPGWGAVVTPRIGMEVVVTFINGDPDRPLVMGCVYNGDNAAPYDVESPTKSIWRTQSCPATEGFNELSFEDAAGDEEIFMHAQKDMRVVIQNEREEIIVDSDDTLTMTNGSKYINFHGIGMEHNIVMDDGCHIYNIIKGDYSILLGNKGMAVDPPSLADVIQIAAQAAAAVAAALLTVAAKKAAQDSATAAVSAAQQAADAAAQAASNGAGTEAAALAAAATLAAAQTALGDATAAYQTAQADLADKQAALDSANLDVDAMNAKQILDAARAVADAADQALQDASTSLAQARKAQNTVSSAYQSQSEALQAFGAHAADLASLNSTAVANNNVASVAVAQLKQSVSNANTSVGDVQEKNEAAQTITQTVVSKVNGLTEAPAIKALFDAVEAACESLTSNLLAATSSSNTAASGWPSGAASTTVTLFADVVSNALTCSAQAVEVKSAADAAVQAALAAYNRILVAQGKTPEDDTANGDSDADAAGDASAAAAPASASSSGGDADPTADDGESEAAAVAPDPAASGTSEGAGGDFTLFLENGDTTIQILKGDFNTILKCGDYTITLSAGDMTIDVTGDISVKASGDISLDAGGDIDITAGGDISLTATNISDMAKLSIDSMAGLTVSSMAGLMVDGMAALAVDHMALLMGGLSALLLVEVGGLVATKVNGKAVAINLPG